MDELKAQGIAQGIPNWPLTDEQRAQITEAMKSVPFAIRRRVRELVRDRWDRQSEAQAPRCPAAVETARMERARVERLAWQDLERFRRSSQAAVDFGRKVFGKKL